MTDQNGHPDSLTPDNQHEHELDMMSKFSTPGGVQVLELLDQPEQLIEAMSSKGHELSVAEVLLSQIYAHLIQDARSGGDRTRYLPVDQTVAGYTKIAAPPSANQLVEIVLVALTIDTAGTLAFVQGNGAAGDPPLSGAFPFAANGGLVLPPTSETSKPWLAASPGQTVGIFTVTGLAHGIVGYRFAQL